MTVLEPQRAILAGLRGTGYVLQMAHTHGGDEAVAPLWDYLGSFSPDHGQDLRPLATAVQRGEETTFEGTVYLRDRTSLECVCPAIVKEVPPEDMPWRFRVGTVPALHG